MTMLDRLKKVVEEMLLLMEETKAFHQDGEVRLTLAQSRSILFNLHRRLSKPRFVMALVGLGGVGKSTLLNALLDGRDLAPRRNRPCTAAPIEFRHGNTLSVMAHYRQNVQRRNWECASDNDVHSVLQNLAEDDGNGEGRDIQRVEVTAPIPLLDHGLVIADTPGFGAVQTGDTAGSHEQVLKEYLGKEVSQVFWVIRAEQGIMRREMAFHDQWLDGICDDIIVTGCEDWSEPERSRFEHRFGEAFKKRIPPTFNFVSGLEGWRARKANDATALERAGIPALERRVRKTEDRVTAIEADLRKLAEDVAYWFNNFTDEAGRSLEVVWPLLSWLRFKAAVETCDLGMELVRILTPQVAVFISL